MPEDRLSRLSQRLKATEDNNDSDNNSSGDTGDGTNGSNGSGSSGGGRGTKFNNTDGGMDDQQTDLSIGSAEYMEYVQAIEADKVCRTVDDVASKSVVFNRLRDSRSVDAEYKSSGLTDKTVKKDMVAARKSASIIKKLERANYEANLSLETAHRNFLRYRSKAAVCNFDSHFDKETRDYGISRDQFLRRHDVDGNGRVNKHDVYLEKNDANHDGCVDGHDLSL